MKRVNYFLPEQIITRLKEAKKKTGISVSEFIRRAVEKLLKEEGLWSTFVKSSLLRKEEEKEDF